MSWKWKRLFLSFILLQVPCSSPITPWRCACSVVPLPPPWPAHLPPCSPSSNSSRVAPLALWPQRVHGRESHRYCQSSTRPSQTATTEAGHLLPLQHKHPRPTPVHHHPSFAVFMNPTHCHLRVRFCWEGGRTCGATCGATLVPIGGQREHCRDPLIFRIKSDAFFFFCPFGDEK